MNWWEELDGPLLGRYRIERLLGEGGMARVFLATDLKTHRIVAIKTPKLESFPPDRVAELLQRFHREFQSQIKDPIQGVVPVFDADEVTDAQGIQRPILVMQYLTGGSLGTRLGGRAGARAHTQTLGEVLDWLVPVASAIDALHRRKFLHRDIKPDNILFDADDKPFLADFGVVGLLDGEHELASTIGSNVTGIAPGSPGYMAPESIHADALVRNAPASDQFSLAITVYEALSGRLPVPAGSAAEWFGALAHWAPASLETHWPERSSEAVAAVMKGLSARPHERFLSCSAFSTALDAAARKVADRESERVRSERERGQREEAEKLKDRATLEREKQHRLASLRTEGEPRRKLNRQLGVLLVALAVGLVIFRMYPGLFQTLRPGNDVLVTEALPTPGLADPGAALVGGAADIPASAPTDVKQDKIETDNVAKEQYVDAAANSGIVAATPAEDGGQTLEPYTFGISYYPGRASVGDVGADTLNLAVDVVKSNPRYRIEIAAFSDALEPDAKALTQRRAEVVADYLSSRGLDRSRIDAIEGKGVDAGAAGEDTAQARARQRRAVVTLHE